MTDLRIRLLAESSSPDGLPYHLRLMLDAAVEIERLTNERDRCVGRIDWLTKEVDYWRELYAETLDAWREVQRQAVDL